MHLYGDSLLAEKVSKLVRDMPKEAYYSMMNLKNFKLQESHFTWEVYFNNDHSQLNIEYLYYREDGCANYVNGLVISSNKPNDKNYDYQSKYYEIFDDYMKIDLENKGTQSVNYVITKAQIKNKNEILIDYSSHTEYQRKEWKEIENYKYDDIFSIIDFKKRLTHIYSKNGNYKSSYEHQTDRKTYDSERQRTPLKNRFM